jgi:hypothetical protein
MEEGVEICANIRTDQTGVPVSIMVGAVPAQNKSGVLGVCTIAHTTPYAQEIQKGAK